MTFIKNLFSSRNADRMMSIALVGIFGLVLLGSPEAAFANDPFGTATKAAGTVATSVKNFALAVGAIGMVACLLMGFFGKLNWKWVSTGIGVSFAIAIVVPTINWLSGLSGNA